MLQQIVLSKSMNQLVFENRNQSYGAFYLRNEYDKHIKRAFGIVFLFFVSVGTFAFYSSFVKPVITEKLTPQFTLFDVNIEPKLEFEKPQMQQPNPEKALGTPLPTEITDKKIPPPVDTKPETPITPGDPIGKLNPKTDNPLPASTGGGTAIITHHETKKPIDNNLVEKLAMFPGGEEAMAEFLANHIHFTNRAKENEVEGKVMLNFVIDEDGNIKDCNIIRGLGFGLDEVAINAINKMPQWIPAEQGHRKVAVVFTLPIEFLLH
ncbi:MAG: hypothetical protein RIQ33_2569 [Bacteroidota bacterium]|jgi:protein TonB